MNFHTFTGPATAVVLLMAGAPAFAGPHYKDPGMQISPASAASAYCAKRRLGQSHNAALNQAIRQNTTKAFGGEQHIVASAGRAGRGDEMQMAGHAAAWCPEKADRGWVQRWTGYSMPRANSSKPAPLKKRLTYAKPAIKPASVVRAECASNLQAVPTSQRLSVLMSACK